MIPDPSAPIDDRSRPHIAVLRFYSSFEDEKGKPGSAREVHWVEYVKKGGNGATTCDKVSRIEKHNPMIWSVVGPAYAHFIKGQEEPADGTPLSAWPGCTTAMADHLKFLHLRSVEDVANTTDPDLERMGMGARALRDKARAFVEAKKGASIVAEALAEARAESAAKESRIADLEGVIGEMRTQIANLQGARRPVSKPGQSEAAD